MMKLVNKIKNYIKKENKMGYEFPIFKVAQIEKAIGLDQKVTMPKLNNPKFANIIC